MQPPVILAVLMGMALLHYTSRDTLERICGVERLAGIGAGLRSIGMTTMGYMGETRNAALKKTGEESTYFGVFKLAAATTGWKSINAKELEKTAHGYETGSIIYIKAMTEGGSGLVKTGEFFYVEKVSANVIKLSQTESIVAEEWTVEIKGTVEFQLLEETTETRKKVEWEAAAAKAKLKSKKNTRAPSRKAKSSLSSATGLKRPAAPPRNRKTCGSWKKSRKKRSARPKNTSSPKPPSTC